MILLDTHALLWLVLEPGRLGARASARISKSTEVSYSAVSISELVIKHMLGKLELADNITEVLLGRGLTSLAFTSAHAQAIRNFPELVGHDPFDRLLLAQALVERADFLTADRRLLALDRDWILDARQ